MSLNGSTIIDANGGATIVIKNDSPVKALAISAISIRVSGDENPGTCRLYYGTPAGDLLAISGNGRFDDALGNFWFAPGGIITAVWENQTPGLQAEIWVTAIPATKGSFQGNLAFSHGGGLESKQWQPRQFIRANVDPPFVSSTFTMLQNTTDDRVFIARNWSGEFAIIGGVVELTVGLYDPTDLPAPVSPRAPLVHIRNPIVKEKYLITNEVIIPPGFRFGGAAIKNIDAACVFWYLFNYQVEPYRETGS